MKKLKLLTENFLVYGLNGIISNFIPFIMLPIITRIMPNTEYYGISDLTYTIVQLGTGIAVMGMFDAAYRMFFEKKVEKYQASVCSTALIFTFFSAAAVFIIICLFSEWIAQLFFNNRHYSNAVFLAGAAIYISAVNQILSAPIRMENKRKIFLATNMINSLLTYVIYIPLLIAGYYVISFPVSLIAAGIIMGIIFIFLNRKWFRTGSFDKELLKQLLKIAIPLLPNFLIYWLSNSCDKIMITNMMGIGAAGVYSISAKFGLASQLIYTAFTGGFQFFAFSAMKEKDQVETNSAVFEYLGIISFIATAFICAWCYPIIKTVFEEEYLGGYLAAPYLFLSPLLQMLFQVAANQFLVIKKTWPNFIISALGVGIHLLLNTVLIPVLGIEGAAISMLAGYVIANLVCVIVLTRMKLFVMTERFPISVFLLACYMLLWRMFFSNQTLIVTCGAFILLCVYIIMYRKEIEVIFHLIGNKQEKAG